MIPPPTTPEVTIAELLLQGPGYLAACGIVFAFGLLFGSFFNVAIYRLPLGLSVNNPKRSFCFRCGTQIRPLDNIPIASALALGFRCRSCGAGFSKRYALIELATGLLFAAIFMRMNPPGSESFAWMTPWIMAFCGILLVGTFTDFDHWIIPAELIRWSVPAALAAALVAGFVDPLGLLATGGPFPTVRIAPGDGIDKLIAMFSPPSHYAITAAETLWWEPVANAVIGAVGASALLWGIGAVGALIFRKDAMGFGDVQLFVVIGAAMGFNNAVLVLVVASMAGTVAGGVNVIRNRMARASDTPLQLASQLEQASEDPQSTGGEAEEEQAARGLAESLELPYLPPPTLTPATEVAGRLDPDFCRRWSLLPIRETPDGGVVIACADPMNSRMVQALRAELGQDKDVDFAIASESAIAKAIDAGPHDPEGEATGPTLHTAWEEYVEHARRAPLSRPLHHLPFIPWIAIGVLVVLFWRLP